jgi:two-component system sensor histidine kinase HydH
MSTIPNQPLESLTPECTPQELRELMHAVSHTADRLQATQDALQHEVERLQQELTETNAQLHRAQSLAALGEMAAGIAHEIRNPLGSIQLYVQMLAEDLEGHLPAGAELCGKIDRAVVGIDAIVRDVLRFSRTDELDLHPISIQSIISSALEGCAALICGHQIQIEHRCDGDLTLLGDPTLLVQVLGNVIRNGIEAMAETPVQERILTVAATTRTIRCPDGYMRFCHVMTVSDQGCGIPEEAIGRLFNPFFTTRATGTGLGLAIAHRIIDAHHGHMTANRRETGGTSFELCIPTETAEVIPTPHAMAVEKIA